MTNILLVIAIRSLPPEVANGAFGVTPWIVSLVLVAASRWLWNPPALVWWDTPFVQQLLWTLKGKSGKLYSLDCAFMGHWEVQFVKGPVPFRPFHFITGHLGCSVRLPSPDERFQILQSAEAARNDPSEIRRHLVRQTPDPIAVGMLSRYLTTMFQNIERGKRRSILPQRFRRFFVNGGNFYLWREHPRYELQEPVETVQVDYEESLFDGEWLRVLHRERVTDLEVSLGQEYTVQLSDAGQNRICVDLAGEIQEVPIHEISEFVSKRIRPNDVVGLVVASSLTAFQALESLVESGSIFAFESVVLSDRTGTSSTEAEPKQRLVTILADYGYYPDGSTEFRLFPHSKSNVTIFSRVSVLESFSKWCHRKQVGICNF